MRIINACSPGWRAGDKDQVLDLIKKLNIDPDKAGTHWNNFSLFDESKYNTDNSAYEPTNRVVVDVHRNLPNSSTHENEVYDLNKGKYVPEFQYTLKKSFTSFQDFLNWVPVKSDDSIAGINSMLKKISIATTWHKERWGLETFVLREEVRNRQNDINEFLKTVTIYPLK
jgi:hypothetical protein